MLDRMKVALKRSVPYHIYKLCKNYKELSPLVDFGLQSDKVLYFKEYGKKNPDKRYYHIDQQWTTGFFALYKVMVHKLQVAKAFNLYPVIEWHRSTCLYSKNCGAENPYEDYFFQPTEETLEDMKHSKYVLKAETSHFDLANLYCGYDFRGNFEIFGEIIRTQLRPVPELQSYLDIGINDIVGQERIIGVHHRGGDYQIGYRYHPKPVTCEQTWEAVEQLMEKTGIKKVFVATDDQRVLNFFKKRLQSNLFYYEGVTRVSDDISVCDTKSDPYMLGTSVLRDVYTLAACTCVISGVSNVAWGIDAINAAFFKPFSERIVLDNGINMEGPFVRQRCSAENENKTNTY